MSKEIIKIYNEKKIFYPRLEIIKDFLFLLLDEIEKTYLGDELMKIQNMKEHFHYCFNKTINEFSKENINIHGNKSLEVFLFDICFKYYYDTSKTKNNIENFKMRLSILMTYSTTKKASQINELLLYYKHFNENLGDFLIF